jgi:hypothetical protein
MRTVHYYTGQPNPIVTTYDDDVRIVDRTDDGKLRRSFVTPHGTLTEVHVRTVDETWRVVEHAAKRAEDLKALRFVLEHRRFRFDEELYRTGKAYVGDRGEAHFWVPKSPWFAVAQQWMTLEDAVFALVDRPAEMADLFRVIDETYDPLYDQLTSSKAIRILNFGENVAQAYLSPRVMEGLLAWYAKRSGQLRAAGIFTHIHIDGNFRQLLPHLEALPFDGLEALTPRPQGDVDLEEMAAAMGDRILLDGIPAVLFLEHHPREELQACVEKIVALFHPRLILGISDELPEGGGQDAWERMAWVASYARTHGGKR